MKDRADFDQKAPLFRFPNKDDIIVDNVMLSIKLLRPLSAGATRLGAAILDNIISYFRS